MMNLNFRSVRATSVRPLVAARPPVAFSGMHAGKLTVGIPQGTPGLVVAAAWPATLRPCSMANAALAGRYLCDGLSTSLGGHSRALVAIGAWPKAQRATRCHAPCGTLGSSLSIVTRTAASFSCSLVSRSLYQFHAALQLLVVVHAQPGAP